MLTAAAGTEWNRRSLLTLPRPKPKGLRRGAFAMFDMALPWWEFVVRATIVYVALLVMVRVSGKRTIGQFTPFELLVVMLLSEAVSNSLSGGDDSIVGALILAATLVALNVCLGMLTARSRRLERFVAGTPVLLGRDGEIFVDVVRAQHVGLGEIESTLRVNDCTAEEMACLFLEADGTISVMKKKKA